MDVRRYTHKTGCTNSDNKNPTFYSTPDAAYRAIGEGNDKAIIICKLLSESRFGSTATSTTNDAEFYPMYVAEI